MEETEESRIQKATKQGLGSDRKTEDENIYQSVGLGQGEQTSFVRLKGITF